ncbi:MAG TPA: hypothetical protein VMH04_11010 [Candidatus Solibacter sp.]|nr:hypothetical protein [Candidatus Solibacter sp.]
MIRDLIRQEWDYHRQRPFGRMVRLFVERIFRGGGDADAEGLDLGVGLVLTLLAMPGGFVSLLLLNKYGTFLQWLRGMPKADVLLVSMPDEYFFIVLSMTVTGAVAVWRWDAIFPDRRDYTNLAPLPVSTRSIFLANLVAVIFLAALVAFDVNAVSCVLFPAVVAATQSKFFFFVQFAAVHALGVFSASLFAFLAVFAALGLLMVLLPPRAFRRVSAYVRGVVVIYLVALLCTSFIVPGLLFRTHGPAPRWEFALPSCWFLGLCQTLRGRSSPALVELGRLTLPGFGVVVAVAVVTYAAAYRRHFVRIAELGDAAAAAVTPQRSKLGTHLQRWVLRTPFQRAGFGFVWKTLLRSEAHRLMLTAIAGLALVLASQALMNAFSDFKSWRDAVLSPDALSIPFILSFFIIVGLRCIFEVPAELRSNWIFQLMVDPDRQECGDLARKIILISALPLVFAVAFAPYVYFAGPRVAALHTLFATLWAVLLTNIVLTRFRKLPFTCTLPVFKQHSIVILIALCFGFLIYAVSTPEFESAALVQPLRMLGAVPVVLIAWLVPRYLTTNTIEIERRMIFEEAATQSVELLRLGD